MIVIMIKQFTTYATKRFEADVNYNNIVGILEDELESVLGGYNRYIKNGKMYERDYRFNTDKEIREATDKEQKLYDAFKTVIEYMREI